MERTLGQQIKGRRKALGLTQAELAHRAGVSRATLIAVEQGSVTQTDTLRVVAEALGVQLTLQQGAPAPENPWVSPPVLPARTAGPQYL